MGEKKGHGAELVPVSDNLAESDLSQYLPVSQYRSEIDPDALTRGEQLTWERQEAFLDAFNRCGTLTKAAKAAGINYGTVYRWDEGNKLDFTQRYRYARQEWRDYLESMVMGRLEHPEGNRGSDVLMMGKMNREDPEHWTRNVQVTHEVGREVMATLQRIQEQQEQQPKPELPEPSADKPWIVEGKVREKESQG